MRWEPFEELRSMRRAMDRIFNQVVGDERSWTWEGTASFPVDVYETSDEVVVKASLPGFRPEDVDISVRGDVLTIKGETRREQKTEQENYYRREIYYGTVSRSLALPVAVQHDKAEADFERGLLTIKLPKAEEVKPKSIKIRPKETIGAAS
ncbi:MAG TPA: Hsp20/alpha crystallin family protein [Dehalococcoidia bacterium]|nr:Hsp20/alpha crystallin family protein [Dehalococcoidia bacterium]